MILPVFFSSLHLLYFAPFLIASFYQCSLKSCLWWALICGSMIDLLSSQTRLGTYAFNYCLTTICLYRYKFLFFEDRLSTLPIMTFCFACVATLIQATLFSFIGIPFPFSWKWMISDLFLSPFQNLMYAGLAFSLPSLLMIHIRKRYSLFRMTKRRKT